MKAQWCCRELSTLNLHYLHTDSTNCGRQEDVTRTQLFIPLLSSVLFLCLFFFLGWGLFRVQPTSGPACGPYMFQRGNYCAYTFGISSSFRIRRHKKVPSLTVTSLGCLTFTVQWWMCTLGSRRLFTRNERMSGTMEVTHGPICNQSELSGIYWGADDSTLPILLLSLGHTLSSSRRVQSECHILRLLLVSDISKLQGFTWVHDQHEQHWDHVIPIVKHFFYYQGKTCPYGWLSNQKTFQAKFPEIQDRIVWSTVTTVTTVIILRMRNNKL